MDEYVGEITVRMTRARTFDVDCSRSGLIGPGLLEGAVPRILNALMQAIAAKDRAQNLARSYEHLDHGDNEGTEIEQ